MAIRGDSFSTVADVAAFCQFILASELTFSASTVPTITQVERMIDRVSGELNMALMGCGVTPSAVYANSTAKLMCDDFVARRVAGNVELTQPGVGFNDSENTRLGIFLKQSPRDFAKQYCDAFKQAGITVGRPTSEGLSFTGLKSHSQRSDPDNTTYEQPLFRRRQFDDPTTGNVETEEEEDD